MIKIEGVTMHSRRERRQAPRFNLQLSGYLEALETRRSRRSPANVINISSAGCHLVGETELLPADSVGIELSWGAASQTRSVLQADGRVVRVEPMPNGGFGLGLSFSSVPIVRVRKNGTEEVAGTPPFLACGEISHAVFGYCPAPRRERPFVKKKYSQPISTAAAQITAMERTYLYRMFHQRVGLTFTEWRRRIRVAEAIRLMSEVDCSIEEAAGLVGFDDLQRFERSFERYTFMTPTQFKRMLSCEPSSAEAKDLVRYQ